MEYKNYLKKSKNLLQVQEATKFVANGVKTEHVKAGQLQVFLVLFQQLASSQLLDS